MKYFSVIVLTALVLTGCGKKEEPATTAADTSHSAPAVKETAQAAEAPTVEPTVEEQKPASLQDSLKAAADETMASVKEAMPVLTKPVKAPETSTDAAAVTEPEPEVAAVEESTSQTSLMDQAKDSAMAMASSVDWANLSWADVSNVPYESKDQLLAWASPQITAMKDKLSKAVMDKGLTSLTSLGDSGWQGAVKTAVEALDTVRDSSPETWEMARGALVSAWDSLQESASQYLE